MLVVLAERMMEWKVGKGTSKAAWRVSQTVLGDHGAWLGPSQLQSDCVRTRVELINTINTFFQFFEFYISGERATRAIPRDVGTKRDTGFECTCEVRISYMCC